MSGPAKPKVLVLDAQAPAATAAIQSLGRHPVELHGAGSRRPLAFGSRRLSRRLVYPAGLDHAGILAWIREIDAAEGYSLVVPSTEISLRILQECEDADDLRRRALMPPRASVDIALDKMETWRLAHSLGIPVPEAVILRKSGTEALPDAYPVVLKTVRSQVPRDGRLVYAGACIARNRGEREAFLEKWLPHTSVQQQRFFHGHGMGVECLYSGGRLRWAFAHERLHELPLTGGASTYRRSIACPPWMLECTTQFLDALQWNGVAMVEFRVNDRGEFVLLEVNPRLWGSLPLAIASGVDFPLGLLRLATGGELGEQPRYRIGYRMRNVLLDVDWMRENWAADHADPLLLTRGRAVSVVQWLGPLVGSEGWDHFSWRDPRPILTQFTTMLRRMLQAVGSRVADRWHDRRFRRLHARNVRRRDLSPGRPRRIAFVGSTDMGRGPAAARSAAASLPGAVVDSYGLRPPTGRCVPQRVADIAREVGLELNGHRARALCVEELTGAEIVVVVDTETRAELVQRIPEVADRIVFLGLFASRPALEIRDPAERADEEVRAIFRQVVDATHGLVRWLGGDSPATPA